MNEIIAICAALGVYFLLDTDVRGVILFSIAMNLFILKAATPGHPLTQSLVLTAVVIGVGTIGIWIINSRDKL